VSSPSVAFGATSPWRGRIAWGRRATRPKGLYLLPTTALLVLPPPPYIGNTPAETLALIALLQIVQLLLNLVWWVIVIQAILSWLIAFNVINTHSDFVRTVWNALQKITEPLYRPIRRILPDFGALDLSPLVVLLILYILTNIVIPNIAQNYLVAAY
jgi:YggT family protein